ncbi:MAG: hypothetical protein HYZ28_16455 [Myxococcales bacterium]|nr:hypothetical protein [Myxococcales bacterium]
MKQLQIDLEDLCIAMDRVPGPDLRWYLDAQTGKTILVTSEYDPAEVDGPSLDEISSLPERYLAVPPAEERHLLEDMQAFARALPDVRLRESLEIALSGPRPHRRFKNVLEHLPEELKAWQAFKRARLLARAREWLSGKGIVVGPTGEV